jgi:hypothetical protein
MLFIKYITDKYGDGADFAPPVTIPKGASFKDMIALKGKSDIGDKINTQIIQPLIDANARLARTDFPDFNDPNKLGEGQAKVDRLTNLIGTIQKPELDFSKNRADHDDILGDAYEYLMRHLATESGKSKGQFYTPAEVGHVRDRALEVLAADVVEVHVDRAVLLELLAHGSVVVVERGVEPDLLQPGDLLGGARGSDDLGGAELPGDLARFVRRGRSGELGKGLLVENVQRSRRHAQRAPRDPVEPDNSRVDERGQDQRLE